MNYYSNRELIADMQRHPSLNREGNDRLYPLVRDGDKAAAREMVEGNMYLVLRKVDNFLRRHRHATHLRDDLTGAGFTGVLLAVQAIARGEVTNINITGYIAVSIGRELENLMDTENLIYVNGRLRRLAREAGTLLKPPTSEPLPADYDAAYDPSCLTDLQDTLSVCCHTEAEHTYMRMRQERHAYPAIATALGVSLSAVQAMRRRLEQRFCKRTLTSGQCG